MSDTMAMQMVIFDRSLETGVLTLRQRLDLPGSPDNLELDLYRGTGLCLQLLKVVTTRMLLLLSSSSGSFLVLLHCLQRRPACINFLQGGVKMLVLMLVLVLMCQ